MAKYVELINKKVNTLDAPYGIPLIFEETIDTANYSEIRMFIHVFIENYNQTPLTINSVIAATLCHNVSSGSWPYSNKEIKFSVTSYIDGWFSEKIIGNKVRVVASAKNFPKGPYTLSASYYLV